MSSKVVLMSGKTLRSDDTRRSSSELRRRTPELARGAETPPGPRSVAARAPGGAGRGRRHPVISLTLRLIKPTPDIVSGGAASARYRGAIGVTPSGTKALRWLLKCYAVTAPLWQCCIFLTEKKEKVYRLIGGDTSYRTEIKSRIAVESGTEIRTDEETRIRIDDDAGIVEDRTRIGIKIIEREIDQ
ncbi:hypothetical protein EVAR_102153_1 [Eumeta japonica]|uniref:Uncharacterized protein n=1 Tax=Eumeta variegata TaxID=151549 RepID=A0A4C1U0M0_EUMVA|nr:hypothetical protein EVAR_102153_1 [Eumeta japonica]